VISDFSHRGATHEQKRVLRSRHDGVAAEGAADDERAIKDSVGNVLQGGDTITVIKDLKVKGSSLVVKVGTKVKNIRLIDGDHDIDCKIAGIGAMKLKSEFVRKA
jgi:protein PhnA